MCRHHKNVIKQERRLKKRLLEEGDRKGNNGAEILQDCKILTVVVITNISDIFNFLEYGLSL